MSQSMLASRSGQYWIHFVFKNIMHILHFCFKWKRLIQFVSKYCHKNCLKYWKKQFSTKSLEAFTLVSSTRFVNMTICATFSCHTITQKSLTVFCFGPVYEIIIKLFFIPKVYDYFYWHGKTWHEIFFFYKYTTLGCNVIIFLPNTLRIKWRDRYFRLTNLYNETL